MRNLKGYKMDGGRMESSVRKRLEGRSGREEERLGMRD